MKRKIATESSTIYTRYARIRHYLRVGTAISLKVILVASLFITLFYAFSAIPDVAAVSDATRILYYSESCSNCQSLIKHMDENDAANLLAISLRDSEVDADVYEADFTMCYPESQIRTVPFLVYDGECFTGSTQIQAFLDQEITPAEQPQEVQTDAIDTAPTQAEMTYNDISTFDVVIILAVIAFFAGFGYVLLFRFRL